MKKILLLFAFVACFVGSTLAQERAVSGKVTDSETGSPMPGVNILIKGTSQGTVTSADGSYKLTVSGSATLVFTFIGFEAQEVAVGTQTTIDIAMKSDVDVLSEVVVVGYGTQSRADLTGKVASISGKEIQGIPVPSLEGAIQGRAAGVFIESGNGKLGQAMKIRVRGASSLSASNQPLFVIDGIPVTSQSQSATSAETNPLADLNMNDIESMEILKDAASAAIYGARATNGVVLITTKKGKAGRTKVNLSYQKGFTSPTNTKKFLNSKEYIEIFSEAARNGGLDQADIDATLAAFTVDTDYKTDNIDTDWQSQVFNKSASFDQVDLSLNGGNEKTRFYVSTGLSNQDGLMIGNRFQRMNLRMNLDHSLSDKVKIGTNMTFSRTFNKRLAADNEFASPMQIVALPPITPIRKKNGVLVDVPDGLPYYNPLVELENAHFLTTVYRVLNNNFVSYEPIKGLTLRGEFGVDLLNQNEDRFWGVNTESGRGAGNTALGQSRWVQVINYTTKAYANYVKIFAEKHNVDLTVGTEYQRSSTLSTSTSGQGITVDALKKLTSAPKITAGSSSLTDFAFLSYFGRLNYKFANKYLVSFTARTDASSRFGADNRFGFFPSGSAGWIVSEESFLKNNKIISFLKLRGSVGLTGNAEIGNFASRPLYTGVGYAEVGGVRPNQIANPDLRWEKTTQTDVGIDFGFLGDRISGEVSYFVKNTNDLLLDIPIAGTNGLASQLRNVGAMKNWGWEFALNTTNNFGDLRWTASLNLTLPKNEVVSLGGLPTIDTGGSRYMNVAQEGQPLGAFVGAEYAGVDPQNGDALFFLADGEKTNNFSRAFAENKKVLGNPNPTFYGGFNNTFAYKGFDLSIFFQWVSGNQIHNAAGVFMNNGFFFEDNQVAETLGRWQKPGDITDIPRVDYGVNNGGQGRSSRMLSDGSYLRLKTLSLGYNLPSKIAKKAFLESARIFVNAQNLLTFTKYKGWDPEVNTDFLSTNIFQGVDFYAAPQPKTITIGLNLGF